MGDDTFLLFPSRRKREEKQEWAQKGMQHSKMPLQIRKVGEKEKEWRKRDFFSPFLLPLCSFLLHRRPLTLLSSLSPPFLLFCKHRKRIIGQLFQFYTTTTCWYRGRGRLCKPPLLVGCFFGKIPEVVPAVLTGTGILTGIAQMAPDVL